MEIIIRGEPQEIDFVQRICRDKVRRGLLTILPATGPGVTPDDKYIEAYDTKETREVDAKNSQPARKPTKKTKKSE